jgi:gluconate kinase
VLLEVGRQELQERLERRAKEHFFNPALLDSQLATLEEPVSSAYSVCPTESRQVRYQSAAFVKVSK